MTDLYLNIADIKIKIIGKVYDYVLYRLRKYISEPFDDPELTIHYEESDNIPFPEINIVKKISFRVFGDTEKSYYTYDILQGNSVSALIEIRKDFKNVYCALKDVEDLGGASLSVRMFNMLGEVIKNAVIGKTALCVHSSSIAYKGSGVIFSAPSGTGKSTHTRLWMKNYDGVTLINDDMPIIRKFNGIWHLCGAPWSGKTEINVNERVPLKAIVFLERGPVNEITEIKPPLSVMKLLEQTTVPVYKEMTVKAMANISSLLTEVKVYRLRCTISDEAPKVVKEKLGL